MEIVVNSAEGAPTFRTMAVCHMGGQFYLYIYDYVIIY